MDSKAAAGQSPPPIIINNPMKPRLPPKKPPPRNSLPGATRPPTLPDIGTGNPLLRQMSGVHIEMVNNPIHASTAASATTPTTPTTTTTTTSTAATAATAAAATVPHTALRTVRLVEPSDMKPGADSTLSSSSSSSSSRRAGSLSSSRRPSQHPGALKVSVGLEPPKAKVSVGQIIRTGIAIRKLGEIDRILKRKHLRLFVVGLVGVLFMILDEEMRWQYGPQFLDDVNDTVMTGESEWSVFDVLLPLSTIALVFCLVDLYVSISYVKMTKWGLDRPSTAFCSRKLRWKFLGELVICLVTPLPRTLQHRLAEPLGDFHVYPRFLGLGMFLRCYLFARVFRDHSYVFVNRHRAVVTGIFGDNIGLLVAVRSVLKRRPIQVMAGSIGLVIVVFNYCIFAIERYARFLGIDSTIDTYPKALWFVTSTLTTAGYGDVYPSMTLGYYTAMVQGLVGMFLTSFVVAAVIGELAASSDEVRLEDWLANDIRSKELNNTAALVVQLWWRFHRARLRSQKKRLRLQRAASKARSVMHLASAAQHPNGNGPASSPGSDTEDIPGRPVRARSILRGGLGKSKSKDDLLRSYSTGGTSAYASEAAYQQQSKRAVKRLRDIVMKLERTKAGSNMEVMKQVLSNQQALDRRLRRIETAILATLGPHQAYPVRALSPDP